jgi:hypothetical protein
MPRWEVWMGVFIHYAIANVVNSLSSLEVKTISAEGAMESETMAAWDKMVGSVLILESHIMDLWREKDAEFEKAQVEFHEAIRLTVKEPSDRIVAMESATEFYHQILELMRRRGFLRFKPPRSFGVKHDE